LKKGEKGEIESIESILELMAA